MSVAVDDFAGGSLLADHLERLGHRRITFVGNPEAALPVRARFAGFQRRLEQVGGGVELEVIPAPLTVDAGLEIGRELVSRPPSLRPTAVATAVDLLAFGVLQSLLSATWRGRRRADDQFGLQQDVPVARAAAVEHAGG